MYKGNETLKIAPCKDGVFSNLDGKPEIIKIDEHDLKDKPPVSTFFYKIINIPNAHSHIVNA
jgi:hypothetical protein